MPVKVSKKIKKLDPKILKLIKNKVILVTGGTGTIGSELVQQILPYQPKQVRIFSRDESKQYYLMEKLRHNPRVRFFIGDVRDKERLDLAMQNVDVVFHAAALKHVPSSEYNPFEAVKTNIMGSQNVIDSALKHNVDRVIAISTDKAANPSNVMGASKLMMEKLVINANFYRGNAHTKFSCVRFGNVAWARGSVLPLWQKQAERHGAITVTDHEMTRFFMTIDQAVQLILRASHLSHGGEIFILKMPAIKLLDLAKMFINKYYPDKKVKIKHVGSRAGEKRHEELYTSDVRQKGVFENTEMLVIIPEIDIAELKQNILDYPGFSVRQEATSYTSDKSIDLEKIKEVI